MREITIDRTYPHVTVRSQIAGVYDTVLTLSVPATFLYKIRDNTSIIAKLFRTGDGAEIAPSSMIVLGYRKPGEVGVVQVGQEMPYSTFRDLTLGEQRDINRIVGRIIQIADEEHTKAERFETSILTGLPHGFHIVIQVNSPDVVGWTGVASGSQISFAGERLTDAEYEADKAMRLQVAQEIVGEDIVEPSPEVGGVVFE